MATPTGRIATFVVQHFMTSRPSWHKELPWLALAFVSAAELARGSRRRRAMPPVRPRFQHGSKRGSWYGRRHADLGGITDGMKTLVGVTIAGVCVAAASVGGYHATSTCTIGVRGTRASITVQGPGATFRCKNFIPDSSDNYYIRSERATEPVLCEGDRRGLHYAVRDDGVLVLVGRVLCSDLNRASK